MDQAKVRKQRFNSTLQAHIYFIQAAGIKVIRTWGFRDMNATYVDGGLPQYGNENPNPGIIYYQSWTNGRPTISELHCISKNMQAHRDTPQTMATTV
jgi:hypothetical protein